MEEGVPCLYGLVTPDYPIEDASEYALYDLLSAGEEMVFVYDFGENWRVNE